MELFNKMPINHSSFVKSSSNKEDINKKNKVVQERVYNPGSMPLDSIDREFMLIAFSA